MSIDSPTQTASLGATSLTQTSTHLQGRALVWGRLLRWGLLLLVLITSLLHDMERSGVQEDVSAQALAERSGLSLDFVRTYEVVSRFSMVFLFLVAGVMACSIHDQFTAIG